MTQIPQQPEFEKISNDPELYRYAFYNPDYKLWVTYSKKELGDILDATEHTEDYFGLKNKPTIVNRILEKNKDHFVGLIGMGFIRNAEFADYVLVSNEDLQKKVSMGQLFKDNGDLADMMDVKAYLDESLENIKKDNPNILNYDISFG